jgi:hypothetical protein
VTAPTLVLLAAGLGSRFGGPKQIAPIGPGGSALIDYAAHDAVAAGFGRLVLIVRGEIAGAVEEHVAGHWPPGLRPEYVRQDLEPAAVAATAAGRVKPLGTAHALVAAASALDGPFGVANADDLYGAAAFKLLADHLAGGGGHALVGYRLANTLLGDRPVNRALCQVGGGGRLTGIVEGAVEVEGSDGERRLTWRPVGTPPSEARAMTGDEPVSMNLWGFTPGILPVLQTAFAAFEAGGGIAAGEELFLPNVVGGHLGPPEPLDVTVLVSDGRCLGVTHPDDVPLLQKTFTGPAW